MRKRRAKESMALASAALACLVGSACSGPGGTAAEPILFVHGFTRDASEWNRMILRFEVDGWPRSRLSAYSYDTSQSNKIYGAKEVRSRVEDLLRTTGASKVDIVAHSMGSLNTRWYIKFLGGEPKVDDWVSLGGPNHGTPLANFGCSSAIPSCVEMKPDSIFLNELNAGDETPGTVNYGVWWSPCDGVVFPAASVQLVGATNSETPCAIHHLDLSQNTTVYTQVREFIK
jgi:triacylglycerol lipase